MSLEIFLLSYFLDIAIIWLNLPVDHLPLLLYHKIDKKKISSDLILCAGYLLAVQINEI
jgi:hypothetical protein